MDSHGSNRPNVARTTRRPVVLGLLGVVAVGLSGVARAAGAASTRPSVAVDFAGPGVARIEPASALASLTVHYLDGGERAMEADLCPTRSGRVGGLRIRYDGGDDATVVRANGRTTALVRVVGDGPGWEVGATNPTLGGVPSGFNDPPTAGFDVSTATPGVGEAVRFASTADDPDLPNDRLEREWDLDGDGTFETRGREVTRTYDSTDEVTVTHRVTDDFGATATARRTVSPGTPGPYERLAKLTADDAAEIDNFGESVAISGDTAVVGARYDDDVGSAYAFVRADGAWTQQAKLVAADPAPHDNFGGSVAVSGDTAVVGASHDDDGGEDSGSAHVFVRSGGVWTRQATLTADDAAADDTFGTSVAVSGDTAVVGALSDDAGTWSGAAYAFVREGGAWTQRAKLVADDVTSHDYFASVAVSGDTVVVGAPGADAGDLDTGAAYVFVREGGAWIQRAKLVADDAAREDIFGASVAVSGDTAVVGARYDDDAAQSSGSAYVFERDGDAWTQRAKLVGDGAARYDLFGYSVATSGDAVVVGALNDDDAGADAGAAYAFVREGGEWTRRAKLTPGDAVRPVWFGASVGVSGDAVLVGAPYDDGTVEWSGAAYVFGR